MAPQRRRKAIAKTGRSQGDGDFDAWIPAMVAILVALFMVFSAGAQTATAGPTRLFDVQKFEATAIAYERAAVREIHTAFVVERPALSQRAADRQVIMAPLPPLGMTEPVAPEAMTSPLTQATNRLWTGIAIAAVLLGALMVADGLWRRGGPAPKTAPEIAPETASRATPQA